MDAKQVARQFARDLKGALGDRLESVVLYGSAARGEWLEGVSDINVLVLLDDIDTTSLSATSPIVRQYLAQRVHPIVVERSEWARATDVFGIELTEMQEWHELLLGADPVIGLMVPPSILRLQAERELRGKLLQLQVGLLVAATPEEIGGLLLRAVPSLVTYYRTALRLGGHAISADSERTVREGAELVRGDASGVLELLQARRARKPLPVTLQDPLVDRFNSAAEELVAYIDNFGR